MNESNSFVQIFYAILSCLVSGRSSPDLSKPQTQVSKVLVLLITAREEDFIQSLKSRKLELEDCEKLYRATRCLLLGSEKNLPERLQNYGKFKVENEASNSEYDVYLVTIRLKEPNAGFTPDADQIERNRAFRTLAGLNVEISDRLRVEVYENTGVYSC